MLVEQPRRCTLETTPHTRRCRKLFAFSQVYRAVRCNDATYKLHGELPSSSLVVRYTAAWNLIGGRTPSRGHGPLENQPEFSATKFTRCIRARCAISSLLCVASSCKSGPLGLDAVHFDERRCRVSFFTLTSLCFRTLKWPNSEIPFDSGRLNFRFCKLMYVFVNVDGFGQRLLFSPGLHDFIEV